ncbi:MAG TPA: hypothetical protein VI756_28665 [Blastocatellia bacterium]
MSLDKEVRYLSLLVLAVLVFLIGAPACRVNFRNGNLDDDKRGAEGEIEKFHARYNAGQFEMIYQDADSGIKAVESLSESNDYLTETRRKYGNVVGVSRHWVNAFLPAPVHVRAVYNTRFSNGEATELFDWVIDDNGRPRLVHYHVSGGTTIPRNVS